MPGRRAPTQEALCRPLTAEPVEEVFAKQQEKPPKRLRRFSWAKRPEVSLGSFLCVYCFTIGLKPVVLSEPGNQKGK